VTETFIHRDVHELLPGGTAVVVDPPPSGASVRLGPAWDTGRCPVLAFAPVTGDPRPSADRVRAVQEFLDRYGVEVVLIEYLDVADRWFDVLIDRDVRVWLRGHGVDVSARLTQESWRAAYRRYAAAAGIVVPSRAAATSLVGLGLPEDVVHVLSYGVDLPIAARSHPSGESVRCVAVGRLVPKKAPLTLLAAFRDAARRNPMLVLDIVGDGPLMADAQRFVAANGLADRVTLHGSQPHEPTLALIASSDVLVHHAVTAPDGDTEGLPLAVLEGMAAGLAVVSTWHAGIPDVVVHGANGWLVREHDVGTMASALVTLAADPSRRADLGAAARATIERAHTHRHVQAQLLTLMGLAHHVAEDGLT